jgi:hypothetical protein
MLSAMTERPSTTWLREAQEQRAAIAAGTLDPAMAYAVEARPADYLAAVDSALAAYEREIAGAGPEQAWAAVERVVEAINEADEEGLIDTIDREDLADWIDAALVAAGVDVDALTAAHGLERHELTDTWRDW